MSDVGDPRIRDRWLAGLAAAGALGGLLGLQALPGAAGGERQVDRARAVILLPPADGTAVPSIPGHRYVGTVTVRATTSRELPVQPGAEVVVRARCGPVVRSVPTDGSASVLPPDGPPVPGVTDVVEADVTGSGARSVPCLGTQAVLTPVGAAAGSRPQEELPLEPGESVATEPTVLTATPPEGRDALIDVYQSLDYPHGRPTARVGAQAPAFDDGPGSPAASVVPTRRDQNAVHRVSVPDGFALCYTLSTPGTLSVLVDGHLADVGESIAGRPSPSGSTGLTAPQVEAPMVGCSQPGQLRLATPLGPPRRTRELTIVTEHFADPGWRVDVVRQP